MNIQKPELTTFGVVRWALVGVAAAALMEWMLPTPGTTWVLLVVSLVYIALWGWLAASFGFTRWIAAWVGFSGFIAQGFAAGSSSGWLVGVALWAAIGIGICVAFFAGGMAWHAIDEAQRRRAMNRHRRIFGEGESR